MQIDFILKLIGICEQKKNAFRFDFRYAALALQRMSGQKKNLLIFRKISS